MRSDSGPGPFLSLGPHCALKRLETPSLYDLRADEIYELDEEAFSFLASTPSRVSFEGDPVAEELVRYCLEKGLVRFTEKRSPAPPTESPLPPSLRYLLVHVTDLCNLRCRHCFIGRPAGRELPLDKILGVAGEFSRLQGLRFIVSGGEPLRHSRFRDLNDRLPDFPFRSILLTNGTLIDGATARALRFHEVQVSIDGLEDAHDLLRGRGSYRKTIAAMKHLAEAGVDLSVATMVHAANLEQFEELEEVLRRFPLKSWSVDVPCPTGNLASNRFLEAPPEKAASKLAFSFGGGYYGSGGPYACGAHLAAVMADGSICKCGHFADRPEGHLDEGLSAVWKRMHRFLLEELTCRCSHLESCRGGCRERAKLFSCIYHPDPIQCLARGVPLGGDLRDPNHGKVDGSERG